MPAWTPKDERQFERVKESVEVSAVDPPWWLLGGEYCDDCLQEYSLTLEYRCVACDRPVCPHCAVVIVETRQVVCPSCEAHPHDEHEAT